MLMSPSSFFDQVHDQLDGRAFSGSVRADKAHNISFFKREVDVF